MTDQHRHTECETLVRVLEEKVSSLEKRISDCQGNRNYVIEQNDVKFQQLQEELKKLRERLDSVVETITVTLSSVDKSVVILEVSLSDLTRLYDTTNQERVTDIDELRSEVRSFGSLLQQLEHRKTGSTRFRWTIVVAIMSALIAAGSLVVAIFALL